jgi:DNA repair protein RecO (recombination protein O)
MSRENNFTTRGIVLRQTNYGEADKIMQLLTPDRGKIGVIAKGVRRGRGKLTGGLELFAVSEITLYKGKGDLAMVTSARIDTFYGDILKDYDRLQLGYQCIKEVSRVSEAATGPEFFELLRQTYMFLNDMEIRLALVEIWFRLQMAILLGTALNVSRTVGGAKLASDKRYNFDIAEMGFVEHPSGTFTPDHIKVLRLLITKNPKVVSHVGGIENLLEDCLWLSRAVSGI